MRITIDSTLGVAILDGIPVRLWRGVTAEGVACEVFVHRIAVDENEDASRFEAELVRVDPPWDGSPDLPGLFRPCDPGKEAR